MPMSKDASQQAMLVVATAAWCRAAEWCTSRCLARVLFPVVHLLQELLGFLLVDKGQAGEAVLELERMEEDAVLIVVPGLINLLVPDDASVRWL